jgi:hypothetical protein
MAVTMKNAVFWMLVFLRSMCRLLVTADFVSSSPILVTLMMKALRSSKMLVLTRATQSNIPADGILHTQSFGLTILQIYIYIYHYSHL